MNINKEDYTTLLTIAEFHFKFSEYIRENDEELFYRAVDYGKTFAKVEGASLTYWHEDNKKFLSELYSTLRKKQLSFDRLVEKVGSKDEAIELWIAKKNTSKEDPIGIRNYLANFMRHARELDYDAFDMPDWINFTNICNYIQDDPKFIEFAKSQVARVLGSDTELLKEFK